MRETIVRLIAQGIYKEKKDLHRNALRNRILGYISEKIFYLSIENIFTTELSSPVAGLFQKNVSLKVTQTQSISTPELKIRKNLPSYSAL